MIDHFSGLGKYASKAPSKLNMIDYEDLLFESVVLTDCTQHSSLVSPRIAAACVTTSSAPKPSTLGTVLYHCFRSLIEVPLQEYYYFHRLGERQWGATSCQSL